MTRARWLLLIGLCLAGAAARIVTFALFPNVAHPDETFQYLEQAYRVMTGRGLVPWEYAVDARSWVLAGLIVPAMKAGLAISPDPAVYLWAVTFFMIALAVAGIAAAFVLGLRAGGTLHAGFAAFLIAVWCELVHLSPHVLADTLCAVPLLVALAVGYRVPSPTVRRMALAGLLFGCAFIFRIQLAPAVAVAMLGICGREVRTRGLPKALGFAVPLLVMGLTDWVTLGAPFRSVLVYLRVNAGGVADGFGRAPFYYYVIYELQLWWTAAPVILITLDYGARRLPLVAIVAAVILVTFSLVGHKEYRFIYPALPLIFSLCGIGTAEALLRLARASTRARRLPAIVVLAVVVWLALDAIAATGPAMANRWQEARGWLAGFRAVNADAHACGLGIDPPDLWFLTGRVRLRAGVPLYDGAAASTQPEAYDNLLVADPKAPVAEAIGPFRLVSCSGEGQTVCRYRREGVCDPSRGHPLAADPGPNLRAILRRMGVPMR